MRLAIKRIKWALNWKLGRLRISSVSELTFIDSISETGEKSRVEEERVEEEGVDWWLSPDCGLLAE